MSKVRVLLSVLAACSACAAAPISFGPAPVYGPPPNPAQHQRPPPPPPPPPAPLALPAPVSPTVGYQYPAAAAYRSPPNVQYQQYQQHTNGYQYQPQPAQQTYQPNQRAPQYENKQQGLWRYTVTVRPPPIMEADVPFQGLGATDSVTMNEMAPFDPLVVNGPEASRFLAALRAREPIFFPEFPHARLVLRNQQHRLNNGLPANRLGSLRPGSQFLRGD